jgi:phasin family protein
MRSVAEEATDAVEDTISTASKGYTDMNLKALDMAKNNVNATFDFWKSMFGAKTMTDMVELNTGFARTQYETAVAQSKALTEMAGDVVKSAGQPMSETYKKAMKDFKLPA